MAVEYSLLVWDDNFQEVHNVMKKYGITLKKLISQEIEALHLILWKMTVLEAIQLLASYTK